MDRQGSREEFDHRDASVRRLGNMRFRNRNIINDIFHHNSKSSLTPYVRHTCSNVPQIEGF